MVSPLWKACSDGDLQKVLEFLNEPSAVDIELKDHTGATPLIEAVRNGYVDIVRVLLENGADPSNSSSQGRPDTYTSDPTILDLLQNKTTPPGGVPPHQAVYTNGGQEDHEKRFYAPPPPPDAYTYYPSINPSLSTVNEPGVYYPPSQPQPPMDGTNGMGNLPPPEVARLIPCRYFPACRYGAQCMFAHPQTTYFQGPMPPVQYPPYDPMGHQYVPQYYPSPPPFQQPPGGHPMSPMSPPPGPPIMHARTPSEVVSPSLGHFSPNGPPPPPIPYGPLSPPVYPHPGQVPITMPPVPPLPPLHPHAPHSAPQPHPNLYNSSSTSVPPFPLHQDAPAPYPVPVPPSNTNYPDANGVRPPENSQVENYNVHPNHREGVNNHRRGSGRRPSFSARKPPCLFFPSGRCKNGEGCRFPHVLSENAGTPTHSSFPTSRGGPPRPRTNGANGVGHLETKGGNMTMRDDAPRQKNGVEGSSRSHSSDAGTRPRFHQGSKHPNAGSNGHVNNNTKKAPPLRQPQQRVPNADEFPVLAGSVTPPNRMPGTNGFMSNGHGHNGPTAAQVLQAPARVRKDGSKESSTRGTSPDPTPGNPSKVRKQLPRNSSPVNCCVQEAKTETHTPLYEKPAPVQEQHVVNNVTKLPVMSFAAAAATSVTNDVSKEVSVSA
ncbi:hypothetical protein GALMADRAFT_357277 [Galerina marginata CBS 339.88]|uniref:C3H1-type domain-containing protein n=1 Tax=Galerina marginata (strain CBS 339.88) TaxID=685588 RepID=A0A067TQC1_GALM3|nr:hypothetical protein GALMADRAFT_357277 [Galerina marginata CBS 339.88]